MLLTQFPHDAEAIGSWSIRRAVNASRTIAAAGVQHTPVNICVWERVIVKIEPEEAERNVDLAQTARAR